MPYYRNMQILLTWIENLNVRLYVWECSVDHSMELNIEAKENVSVFRNVYLTLILCYGACTDYIHW